MTHPPAARLCESLAAGEWARQSAPTGHEEAVDVRATFTVRDEKLTDAEAYERFVGNAAPDAEVAAWADGLTAELLNDVFGPDGPYTDEDAAEVRAAIAQYISRQ